MSNVNMKAKIISHEVKVVEWNTILHMIYSYKGFESSVSIVDLPELPTSKVIKQYIKTAEKAINTEIKLKEDGENKFKKDLKQKQKELDEMRAFVNSRSVDQKSTERAIAEFKKLNK